jgi:aspartyl-tRNA(Asn)/glutamyl-tRNA(Gln) amidotransferase subunit A
VTDVPVIDWPALESANAPLNAFVDFDRTASGGEGPLAGVTVGVKSNIAVKGLPWTAGMGLRRDMIATADAPVVAALRAAGAIILGTLNMHEAALGATTDNVFYGRTHNPHRLGHTPGGSSGGSGAAAAAGLCDIALGTDTLGSVRIPAAYNGIYGLKPGIGAVGMEGIVPLGRAFDMVGPMARSLKMIARAWAVIGPAGQRAAPLTRFLTLDGLAGVVPEPAVKASYDRALAALGAPVEAVNLADSLSAIRVAALADIGRELVADLGAETIADPALVSDELRGILRALQAIPSQPDVLARTRQSLLQMLGDDGVLILPTTPQVAFAHGQRSPANQADFSGIANVAGLPALAIPAGLGADRLPVSVQLIGPPNSEVALLDCACVLDHLLGGYTPPPHFPKE